MKNKKTFDDFQEVKVKTSLNHKVLLDAKKNISPDAKILIFKYSSLFIFSCFISLMICPQRGLSLSSYNFNFIHHFFHQSEILCGLFCGAVFFITTHLLTFILLTHFERVSIVKNFTFLPMITISLFFGLSMTTVFSNADVSLRYSTSWILVTFSLYLLSIKFYKEIYFRQG